MTLAASLPWVWELGALQAAEGAARAFIALELLDHPLFCWCKTSIAVRQLGRALSV